MRSRDRRIALFVLAAAGAAYVGEHARHVVERSRPSRWHAADVPIPPWLPDGRVLPVPGVGELFVRDTGGARPAVLLLHGWGATADTNFFNAYSALGEAYRVVALDHRGHGRGLRPPMTFTLEQCADDAAALLQALEIDKAVVVGYSMGGPVALLLAHRHPTRCAGLVLEATALEFHSEIGERALWRGLNLLETGLRHGSGDRAVLRVLKAAVDAEPSLDVYRAWLAGEFRRGTVRDIVEAGRALSLYDARPFASALRAPTAVVLTTEDRLVAPRKQRELARALNAVVFELAGDHDVPVTGGRLFGSVTRAAVDHVAARAGLASGVGAPLGSVA